MQFYLLRCYHPNLFGFFFADAEVVAGYLYGHGVAHGGDHLYPYGLAGDAAHFHKRELEITFFVAFDHGPGTGG